VTGFGANATSVGEQRNGSSCPECMDRLPFASEVVLSEVADMYPAC